jgi:hypothetical protein
MTREIMDFPIKSMVDLSIAMLVYQRVPTIFKALNHGETHAVPTWRHRLLIASIFSLIFTSRSSTSCCTAADPAEIKDGQNGDLIIKLGDVTRKKNQGFPCHNTL